MSGTPTKSISNFGLQFSLGLIDEVTRKPVLVTLTNSAIVAPNGEEITFATAPATHGGSGVGAISVPAATQIKFAGGVSVIVLEDVMVSATPQTVKTLPITLGLAAAAVSEPLPALFPLYGFETGQLQANDQSVSTRGSENGIFSKKAKVAVAPTISCNISVREGDPALALIKPRGFNDEELWVQFARSDGEIATAVIKIMGYNENYDINQVLKATFNLDVQGKLRFTKVTPYIIPDLNPAGSDPIQLPFAIPGDG